MIKTMGIFKKKPGMSPAEFQEYYESTHVPLILKSLSGFSHYRRNYPIPNGWAQPHFDVITELCYENREVWERSWQQTTDPSIIKLIQADEAHFLDRTSCEMFVVDERISR